ncbi:MAG: outer membrane protein assembly factor BamD [Thermoanaerobaculia bacterium]|nr:outer membrane protein assembly factor BamD [Thermoanaerobaculia bacterium]
MKRTLGFSTVWLLLLLLGACRSGRNDDPILLLSAEEALEQGKAMMAKEKWYKARRLLTHAFEVEPNSRSGREALLLSADTLYLQGGDDNYIKCEAKYRDFLNRFPTSNQADYAQYQVGNCLAGRMERPDRDQQVSRQAVQALEELLRLYPTSQYAGEARAKLDTVRDNLAEYELVVARFYLRYRGLCYGAIQRLLYLEENFPSYSQKDKALYYLGVSYERCKQVDKAEETFGRLAQDFPESPYTREAAKEKHDLVNFAPKKKGQKAKTPEHEGAS